MSEVMGDRGYMGKILHVELPSMRVYTEALTEDIAYHFLGGKGLGAYLLFKMLKPKTPPLSPDNVLIFATGPLTGTIAPTGNRFCVVTKSPATGTFDDSHCGGPFGIALKRAGYDALVIRGAADELSILVIDEDHVDLASAKDLAGMFTYDAEREIKSRLGRDFEVAVIGPAGERMAPIAGIFSALRAAGRGGTGAVMGSKKLKAVAVRGHKPIKVYDPKRFRRFAWIAHRMVRMHESTARHLPRYGSANILETINEMGALPTRNYRSGVFERAEEVAGERWRETLWIRDVACKGCPIACSKVAYVKEGPFKGTIVDGPDYETIWALGPQCGISSREAIAHANQLCDLYGIDTISTGNIIAFIMECYERGILTEDELDGLRPMWGDGEVMVKLVEKIGKGEGIGGLLQQGVRRIAEYLIKAKGAEECLFFAMHVKGLELPAYEPRAAQGMGLGYATSDRGACHLRGWTAGQELLGYGGAVDPLTTRGKAQLVIDRQNEKAVVDSVGICFYAFQAFTLKEIRNMLVSCTGLSYRNNRELYVTGERIYNLTRLFNVREGFTAKDDSLPERLLKEPAPEGPAKGHVVRLEEMLKEYYALRGWDENGIPTKEKLEELGLSKFLDISMIVH